MMGALLFAATLSAGNVEFEDAAAKGAYDIVAARERARLVAEGPAKGALAKAMLSKPEAFAKAGEAKEVAWKVYQAMIEAEYATLCKVAGERLGIGKCETRLSADDVAKSKARFDGTYDDERSEACAEQAASLVGYVRPSEAECETKDETALRREMCEKIAAQQRTAVFEENLAYISRKIVEPMLEAAKRERKRQEEYLRRARSKAYAPSALKRDLTDKLALNVKERKAKTTDPTAAWDIFPSVTNVTLRSVVHRRTMDRFATQVAEIPFEVKPDAVNRTINGDRARHRKAKDSQDQFRQQWEKELCKRASTAVCADAPKNERQEFGIYLTKNASDKELKKAVDKRIAEDFMPKLDAARRAIAAAEFARTWATLKDQTWWPYAELTDRTAANPSFAAVVRTWRKMPGIGLAKGENALEEAAMQADKAVFSAFETARGAVVAQTKIVDEVHPSILAEAKEKKESFWSRTPDFDKVVAMLTEAVEARWAETKVTTLWARGQAPKNADEQHAELFPSVRKRIELVAKSIMAEINQPVPEDQPTLLYSIVVSRQGEHVTVKLDQGGKTLVEKSPKAQMGAFRGAMREVGEKLGKEILELK